MIGIGIALNLIRRAVAAILANLYVDENGDHLTDENGDRLGEI